MEIASTSLRAIVPRALLVLLVALTAGCSAPRIPGVYKIDIQQGNVVTRDMLAGLEPGMDKRRVRFVLGTPLLADAFHENRWDYIYTFEAGGGRRVQRNVSVFFEDDRLVRLEGDVRRGETRGQTRPARRDAVVKVTGPREEPGFLSNLNPFSGDGRGEAALDPAAEEAEAAAKAATEDSPPETPGPAQTGEAAEGSPVELPSARDSVAGAAPLEGAGQEVELRTRVDDAAGPPASDAEPGWWERVKESVGGYTGSGSGGDESAPADDRPTLEPEQPTTGASAAARAAPAQSDTESSVEQAQPEPAQTDARQADTDSNANDSPDPAAQADPAGSTDEDGGFFARIRDRFKLPPLPEIQAPSEETPGNDDR